MLTVLTPATTSDLTVLATVKAEMGITDRASDVALAGFIRQASDVVAKFCNRVFARETVSQTIRLDHRHDVLILKRFPIASITAIVENDVALGPSDYELNGETGVLQRLHSDTVTFWPRGKVVVTYTSGFDLPRGLPSGIERAAILLVKSYASGGDRDPMVRSETIDGAGSTDYFSGGATGLPPEVEGLLIPHRKSAME